jgi:OmpA-OmpF porin, OOP family
MKVNDLFNRWELRATLFLLAVIFAGCGVVRNPALERARDTYESARQDPEVAGRAAVALDKARLTLEQAERLWATEKDVTEVEHIAYIAEKRVEIARVTAKRRLATDEIQQLKTRRE